MNYKKNILLLLLFFPIILNAKRLFERYEWDTNPAIHQLSSDMEKESAIIIENFIREEYIYNDFNNIDLYRTVHKIIRVNDDKAIERFNKVYISMTDVDSVISLKARSIAKDGKVTEINKNSIKLMDKNENNGVYKIFAIEGLEKGSEIEYFYILKKYPSFFNREFLQFETPVKHERIEVITPEKLVFKAKTYNGFPELKDTVISKKRILRAEGNDIPETHDEEYSSSAANIIRVELKLSKNLDNDDKDLLTWQDAAQSIYKRIYNPDEKNDYEKKIQKIIDKELLLNGMDEPAKIKAIENYIKTTYTLKTESGEGLNVLNNILKNKYGSTTGIVRLYAVFFNLAKIKHEVVLTTDRKEIMFDGDFDTWNYLENYLFYFPGEDKFISPVDLAFRYPLIPPTYTGNDGLFIKGIALGKFSSGYGEVKHIPIIDAEFNYDNHDAAINFSNDFDDATMHLKRSMSGYNAMPIQPFYQLVPEDKRREIIEGLLKDSEKDAKISNIKAYNYDPNSSPFYKPFIVEGDLQGTGFIEKAGHDYLFKIGTVIGPQSQLYEEKKRRKPIMNDYNRRYDRNISFNIPKGYKVKNLNELNMDIFHTKGDIHDFSFTSSYKIEGDKVTVRVEEYYKSLFAPVEDFDSFRKVINASADFNKITLVFEKQ